MTGDSIEVKVIEKAYKKLALDALVIQQGRLADQNKTMSKDELQQMVTYLPPSHPPRTPLASPIRPQPPC